MSDDLVDRVGDRVDDDHVGERRVVGRLPRVVQTGELREPLAGGNEAREDTWEPERRDPGLLSGAHRAGEAVARVELERRPVYQIPLLLFLLTCLSTLTAGGPVYAAAVLIILGAHEMGHYLQARRYGVPASLPYFLPLPLLSPFGTAGAVIAMRPHRGNGRALFDIAITGPLAGLVPTLIFAWIGYGRSSYVPISDSPTVAHLFFERPLILKWISEAVLGAAPPEHTLMLDPMAFAAWVGIFVTALNLLPIGQLDGGHLLYALIPRYHHRVSMLLFAAALVTVVAFKLWMWSLMLVLLWFVGLRHPPVDEDPPFSLGPVRRVLGVLLLFFVFVGLTAEPLRFVPAQETPATMNPIESTSSK